MIILDIIKKNYYLCRRGIYHRRRTCVNDCTIYCGVFEIIRDKNEHKLNKNKPVNIKKFITTCVTMVT